MGTPGGARPFERPRRIPPGAPIVPSREGWRPLSGLRRNPIEDPFQGSPRAIIRQKPSGWGASPLIASSAPRRMRRPGRRRQSRRHRRTDGGGRFVRSPAPVIDERVFVAAPPLWGRPRAAGRRASRQSGRASRDYCATSNRLLLVPRDGRDAAAEVYKRQHSGSSGGNNGRCAAVNKGPRTCSIVNVASFAHCSSRVPSRPSSPHGGRPGLHAALAL